METFLTAKCSDERILEVAKSLSKIGLEEFAEKYYNEGGSDFFKITKGEENIVHAIYLDLDDGEYSVHGFYGHEHVGTLQEAINYIEGLYNGKIAESVFILPFCTATAFVSNDRPQKEIVSSLVESVFFLLNQNKSLFSASGHFHVASQSTLSMIKFEIKRNELPQDAKLVVRVGVMGTESDDVYIFN